MVNRTAIALIVAAIILSGIDGSAINTPPIEPQSETLLWLHTEGKNFADENYKIVYLRGCNYDGLQWMKSMVPYEEDLVQMKGWGFNIIRLPFSWHYFEEFRDSYDWTYIDKLAQIVEWAKDNGIYTLLDFHKHRGAIGQTIPAWFTIDGTPEGRELTVDEFIANVNGVLDEYYEMWALIAGKFKHEPAVIGYDLMNEPDFSRNEDLNKVFEGATNAIRAVDSKHIIFVEGEGGYGDVQGGVMDYPNVAFANFGYFIPASPTGGEPYTGRNQTNEWGLTLEQSTLEHMRGARDTPALQGEFGWAIDWYPTTPSVELYVRDMWDILDEYGISGTWWQYPMTRSTEHGQGMSLVITDTRAEQTRFFTSGMDRPYVRKTTIKPNFTAYDYPSWTGVSWERKSFKSFDLATKEFQFVTAEGSGTHQMEIYVPQRFYPNGFRLTIDAPVSYTWDADNRILRMSFDLSSSASMSMVPNDCIEVLGEGETDLLHLGLVVSIAAVVVIGAYVLIKRGFRLQREKLMEKP